MQKHKFKVKTYLLYKFIWLLFLLSIFLFPLSVLGQERVNNKYGIHLAQPHFEDLESAQKLINSEGGDWGYVTLVLQENDRSKEKWQEIFDRLRRLHLIPIIRLATFPEGAQWKRPAPEEAGGWATFLDSLNWVTKNRYIILFNEPNHGAEWGGSVDSESYAKVALEFASKLKEKNQDYFIMLAGLDASAPQSLPNYEDEANFIGDIFNNIKVDQFNKLFSGWASHSYPNPGFAGATNGVGRGTVRTYQWEKELLKNHGIGKNIPVFITETGWVRGRLSDEQVAQNLRWTFENVWIPDPQVMAVTPFVLNYQGEPFLNFSWKMLGSEEFYPQFYTIQSLEKSKGDPQQIEKGEIEFDSPNELVSHSSYHFLIHLKNEGQALWDKDFGYQLSVASDQSRPMEYFFSDLKDIRPFEEADVDLYIKTNGTLGKRAVNIVLKKNNDQILSPREWKFEIFPLPSLSFSVSKFPPFSFNGNDFEIQIFNDKEELVYKKKNIKVEGGEGFVNEVQNIALARKYRIVVLKKGYLPRQTFVQFQKGNNAVKFKMMLPFDFNGDGKFDLKDILH